MEVFEILEASLPHPFQGSGSFQETLKTHGTQPVIEKNDGRKEGGINP